MVGRRQPAKLFEVRGSIAGTGGFDRLDEQPPHEILPYVRQPEELVPGEPLFYASAMAMGGYAQGVLVKSREGHPIKIEGNPDHPATPGGSDIWMQAAILELYDLTVPKASRTTTRSAHGPHFFPN